MDNLTHSLIGAIIGQTGLKRLSGLGMPTLIIAANIPDIDATCTIYGMQSLAMRRGLSHGPIALILLPIILTAAMVGWDRWQTLRGKRPSDRPPVRPIPLFLLALIGTLSHPLFDWFNNYGIRLLEPFSQQWFYGDTLFIIDLWIWIGLGLALWQSRRREKRGVVQWARPAQWGLAGLIGYVLLNAGLSYRVEREGAALLAEAGLGQALVVASPPPLMFWKRDIFWRTADRHGSGRYDPLGETTLDVVGRDSGMNDLRIAAASRSNDDLAAFLFWARMPFARQEGSTLIIGDQRYASDYTAGRFEVRLDAQGDAAGEGRSR